MYSLDQHWNCMFKSMIPGKIDSIWEPPEFDSFQLVEEARWWKWELRLWRNIRRKKKIEKEKTQNRIHNYFVLCLVLVVGSVWYKLNTSIPISFSCSSVHPGLNTWWACCLPAFHLIFFIYSPPTIASLLSCYAQAVLLCDKPVPGTVLQWIITVGNVWDTMLYGTCLVENTRLVVWCGPNYSFQFPNMITVKSSEANTGMKFVLNILPLRVCLTLCGKTISVWNLSALNNNSSYTATLSFNFQYLSPISRGGLSLCRHLQTSQYLHVELFPAYL